MSQTKIRREKHAPNKDTRWDRIRKRHLNGCGGGTSSISLKTDAVRRFIEMDFIGKQNESLLNGEKEAKIQLNPVLVMNLRHEMFQKIPRQLPLATVANQKNLDSCIAHNVAVEEHYIENELNKFRHQLEKNHKRNNKIKVKVENSLRFNNEALMRSLETTSKHIADFYAAPIEAMQEVDKLCSIEDDGDIVTAKEDHDAKIESDKENKKDETIEEQIKTEKASDEEEEELLLDDSDKKNNDMQENKKYENDEEEEQMDEFMLNFINAEVINPNAFVRRTPSPLTPTDELLKPMKEAAERYQHNLRCVRFVEDVEVHKFHRENSSCSNTSDGIDSVISDLAEEALMELQMEEQAKLNETITVAFVTSPREKLIETTEVDPIKIEGTTLSALGDTNKLLVVRRLQMKNLNEQPKRPDVILTTSDEDNKEDESASGSNHEQNLIIEQLFQARAHSNIDTKRKYFLRWIHYTTIEKIERESYSVKNDRVHKINAFLDKIRREKVRLTKSKNDNNESILNENTNKPAIIPAQVTKKYQNKIKVQQDIIDLQRHKLERQERLIMELKLHKLSEESKEARQDIKNELKAVIRSGDPKAKAKAKCLQLIGNLRDTEDNDEFARLRGKALLVPQFLQTMQDRALERSIRHEQARQRRLQHDAEKEAQKAALEEAKRLEDEEAKQMRIELLKEKRRQEKMAKVLKERERQRALENHRKSQDFCRHLICRNGMEGFKRLLQRKRENLRKCEKFRREFFKRTYFVAWRDYYVFLCERKHLRAEDLYAKILKRNTMAVWRIYTHEERSKYQVAVDWYELKLSETMFLRWSGYTQRMKMIEETKMRQATSHHEWHLKWKVLDCWQRLPQILQLEMETEARRQRWRMKIWELLPDYKPNRDDFLL